MDILLDLLRLLVAILIAFLAGKLIWKQVKKAGALVFFLVIAFISATSPPRESRSL